MTKELCFGIYQNNEDFLSFDEPLIYNLMGNQTYDNCKRTVVSFINLN